MPNSADLERAARLVCLGQGLRLKPSTVLPPSHPKIQQRPFSCSQRAPKGSVHPGTGSPAHPKCRALSHESSTSKPHAGLVLGYPHPLCSSVQPVPSPLCCHVWGPGPAGSVSPARPHTVLLPCRSWSGPWSPTAQTRSPLLSTPLPPTRARRLAAATPARRPPRRPGEPPAPRLHRTFCSWRPAEKT